MKEIYKIYKESYNFKWGHRIYEVSNLGNVKCNDEPYQCRIGTNGYKYLCGELLHRIVAELFLPDWKKDYEIDHINTVKTDNRVENLRICHNRKENMNNPITLNNISKAQLGKTISIEGRINIANDHKGLHHSEETKLKIKQAWAKRKKQ